MPLFHQYHQYTADEEAEYAYGIDGVKQFEDDENEDEEEEEEGDYDYEEEDEDEDEEDDYYEELNKNKKNKNKKSKTKKPKTPPRNEVKNEEKVRNEKRKQYMINDLGHLMLPDVDENDKGNYSCFLYTPHHSVKALSAFFIDVIVKGWTPFWFDPPFYCCSSS